MKLIPRSTGSLVLTAVALALAIGFSVWSVVLAVSVSRFPLTILAALSVLTVFVLVILLRSAQLAESRHRAVEQSVRESQQLFRSMLAAVPDVVIVLAADGRYRNVFTSNPDLLYRPADELVGQTIHDVLPENVAKAVQDVIDRTIESASLQQFEYPLPIRGEMKWLSARVVPYGSKEDPAVLWVAHDNTDHKRAADHLRQSEERFRQLAENIDETFWLISPDEKELYYVSPAYETISGRSCQSLYDNPRSWLDTLHPEDRREIELDLNAQPVPYEGHRSRECRVVRPDGDVHWVWLRSRPVYDDKGSMVARAGVAVDFTERKRAEEGRRESESRFRSVLAAAPDVILVLDAKGEYRNVFTSEPDLLFRPVEELLGKSIHDLFEKDQAEAFQAVIDNVVDSRSPQSFEYPLTTAGEERWFSARVVPFGSPEDPCVLWVARDFTDHKRAEERLRESEARFRQVAENIDEVVSLATWTGRGHDYVSPAYETIWGKSCESLYENPKSWQDNIHPDDKARVVESFEKNSRLGRYDEEFRIVRDDGTVRWVRDRAFPIRDENGEVYRIAGLAHDITARKKTEEVMRESAARFRSIFEQAASGIVTASPEGRFLQVNEAMCRFLGYTEEEMKQLTIPDVTHPEDLEATRAQLADSLAGRRPIVDLEKRYLRKDGSMVWGHVTADWLFDADGKPQYIIAMHQDITQRKRAEEGLRESEKRFRQLADNLDEVVWLSTWPDRNVVYVSPAYAQIWGRSCQSLYDHPQSWQENIHPEDRRRVVQSFEANVPIGKYDEEFRITGDDGSVRWIRDRAFPISDADGNVHRIAGISEDITERKRVEQALREANEELELRVRQRTADLETANELLKLENVERHRAEKIQYGRNKVLQQLAAGASLDEVLTVLLESMEDVYPEMICSLLLLDEDKKHLRHGAALRLPDFYNEAIDGLEIGPRVGSCGTAAYSGELVIVEDVMTHPYWEPFRELARQADIGACWSVPVISSTNEVLGTFAIYYRQPRRPEESDVAFVNSGAHLAGIAIERKRAEAELEESHARLRVADRLASLGTLTAGLGHDMNNVLFPIRCRFDALDWKTLPPELKELLTSTRETVDYLQQLAGGLRLLATDVKEGEAFSGATSIPAWWDQVQPLMAKIVPSTVTLETDLAEDLPSVRVAPHQLTQAVLNLVINAAEAMPDGGRVQIGARRDGREPQVCISVRDEGIGMTEEIGHRAFDPFYTTKKRSLSTGLGLTLVHNVVRLCGGMVNVESTPGRGTTIELVLPVAEGAATAVERAAVDGRGHAVVSLRDRRTAAWVTNVLRSVGYEVRAGDGNLTESALWVTEPTAENLEAARQLSVTEDHRVIVLGSAGSDWEFAGAVVVEDVENLEAIRSAVREATSVQP